MAIARIGLARSVPRILAIPAALLVLAAAAIVAGFFLPEGAAALAVWVAAGVLMGAAALLALVPLTLRLEVEVGGLRVRWLLGGRRFRLVPGAVTRAAMGQGHGVIRHRMSWLGWAYGGAVLRDEEPISILRLAPTPSVILVPTDRGRLGIAARSEPELLEGLAAAARVQQRLDEVSGRLAALPPEPAAAPPAPSPDAPPPEPAPRLLTGIERARLEAELAAARRAALEAAEAERRAIAEAQRAGAAAGPVTRAVAERRPEIVEEEEAAPTALSASRRRIRARWERPGWARPRTLRALGTLGWGLLPIVATLGAYLAIGGGALAGSDVATRLEVVGLVACGPLAALGVLAARTWWPRLAGLVAVTALLAVVILFRAATG